MTVRDKSISFSSKSIFWADVAVFVPFVKQLGQRLAELRLEVDQLVSHFRDLLYDVLDIVFFGYDVIVTQFFVSYFVHNHDIPLSVWVCIFPRRHFDRKLSGFHG